MNINKVSTVLNQHGLAEPVLKALIPNEANFSVLLMQPRGQIEASVAGVRNRDRKLAHTIFESFLIEAQQKQADLVITPEYSMPWETLIGALKGGIIPAAGKLWAIGCESIKYNELNALKESFAQYGTIICEPLEKDLVRFTDPLAYVFLAPTTADGVPSCLTILVQFKTYPMGDKEHFECNGLQRGTCIYQFGGNGRSIKLLSLICSDAFDFLDEQATAVYDHALIIHIQLNPKPRHDDYRRYRDRLLRFQGDETEIICLNWAGDVEEWCADKSKCWKNISGSAWYLKPDKFDEQDTTLIANHRRGLYYSWLAPLHTHVLFFNYMSATYFLQATKVAHIGVPASISRRRGPQLIKTSIWDVGATAWIEQGNADDGFISIVGECGKAKDEIKRIADRNPFEVERVLALCAGKIVHSDDWHSVRSLDSCSIDLTEVIRRITFCQDTDQVACDFRIARLKRCCHLWNILNTNDLLPPALEDFKSGIRFEWIPSFPHQNVISPEGKRATVIYLGEESHEIEIEAVVKKAAEYLHRGFSEPNASHNARQRLAVWYRGDDGQIKQYDRNRFTKFNQPGDTSEFDIGRES